MSYKERFSGIQSRLLNIGKYGCNFLSLLSIAEEFSEVPIDLIEAVNTSFNKGFIRDDYFVFYDTRILKEFTGKTWTRRDVKTLPEEIKENEFTIAEWYNPLTKFTHFRRRSVDTLEHSITVRDGSIVQYRIYTVEA